jgi:hypothetical protein
MSQVGLSVATSAPLPLCGGARAAFGRAEGGTTQAPRTHARDSVFTLLPRRQASASRWGAAALPHKGGGGASGTAQALWEVA